MKISGELSNELRLTVGKGEARVRREPPAVGSGDGPKIPVFSGAELDEMLFEGGTCEEGSGVA